MGFYYTEVFWLSNDSTNYLLKVSNRKFIYLVKTDGIVVVVRTFRPEMCEYYN